MRRWLWAGPGTCLHELQGLSGPCSGRSRGVGLVKGRVLCRLLDQMELLNGVDDHRLLVLPRMG